MESAVSSSTNMKEKEWNALFYSKDFSKNLNFARTLPKDKELKMALVFLDKIADTPISRMLTLSAT